MKSFQKRELSELFNEIDLLADKYPSAGKVFLADGDALTLDSEYLLELLKYLQKAFVKLKRVSVYATAQNLLAKTPSELKALKEQKLSLLYFGIETGNETLLKKIHKGVNASQIIEALNKATDAGIKTSATVILGIGGLDFTKEHIEDTAKIVNATQINHLATLQLGLEADVIEKFLNSFDNDFIMLDDDQVLDEQKRFIELLEPENRVIFRSNHASNALHLAGTLPKDKERLLGELQLAMEVGERAYVPKVFRGF
jgi:coproporphyrinogen III oxidase-like Fe-S oxidoreductase